MWLVLLLGETAIDRAGSPRRYNRFMVEILGCGQLKSNLRELPEENHKEHKYYMLRKRFCLLDVYRAV